MSLIYSCVCRAPPAGSGAEKHVLLAEHTAFSGNFKTVTFQCLEKVPSRNDRFTFAVDGHTFNFLVNDRVVYGVVATEQAGRTLPFGFLEKIKEEFLVGLSSLLLDFLSMCSRHACAKVLLPERGEERC